MNRDIITNAELVITTFQALTDFDFGYNLQSVKWLQGYLERINQSNDLDENARNGLVNTIGSYLGQCIIERYGGEWGTHHGVMGIKFDERNWAFPFNKVEKCLANSGDDSLYSFFTGIPAVFGIRIKEPIKKPWWKIW